MPCCSPQIPLLLLSETRPPHLAQFPLILRSFPSAPSHCSPWYPRPQPQLYSPAAGSTPPFPPSHPVTLSQEHDPPCQTTATCPLRTPPPHTEILHNSVSWWPLLILFFLFLPMAVCLCTCCLLCIRCSQHIEESSTCCCGGLFLLILLCRRRKHHDIPQDILEHSSQLLFLSPPHSRDSITACIARSQSVPFSDFANQIRAYNKATNHFHKQSISPALH